MNPSALSELQLDALREISGIGAGHAATALSALVERPIRLEVPTIEVIDVTEVARVFGGPEQVVGAVYARLAGDIEGGVLCVATPEAVRAVVEMLGGEPADVDALPDESNSEMLVEAANTLIGSYLEAIAEMTGLVAHAVNTSWAFDMAGALFQAVASEIGMRAEHAVLARTAFLDSDRAVEASFFFLPDPESLATILGRLGLA